MQSAKLLNTHRPTPKDIHITPSIYIIGKPKTGKSSLAKLLSKQFGCVIIKLKHIIEEFVDKHRDPLVDKILNSIKSGQVLSDEYTVDLIERRVQMTDCVNKGWILDGMPKNKTQCEMLIRRGLGPSAVFSMCLSDNDIKKRVLQAKQSKYGYNPTVIN